MAAIPWSLIVGIVAKLLDIFLTNKETRDKLKLQMFEFARRFDVDAVEGNATRRDEYRQMKKELEEKARLKEQSDANR